MITTDIISIDVAWRDEEDEEENTSILYKHILHKAWRTLLLILFLIYRAHHVAFPGIDNSLLLSPTLYFLFPHQARQPVLALFWGRSDPYLHFYRIVAEIWQPIVAVIILSRTLPLHLVFISNVTW